MITSVLLYFLLGAMIAMITIRYSEVFRIDEESYFQAFLVTTVCWLPILVIGFIVTVSLQIIDLLITVARFKKD